MKAAIGFQYSATDADGYEIRIIAGGQYTCVGGSIARNNGLGDLVRAAAAIATGQWAVDMWHGEATPHHRVRFSLMRVERNGASDRQWGVRVEVHDATAFDRLVQPPRIDAIIPSALALAEIVHADTARHITDWWGDDLAHAVLGKVVALLKERGRVGPSPSA
ncbi:MAG: hypothetical protein J0H88_24500 [Sphingomonadales bacterium]|nr:hypothetical protein [Sphingomonadales bacterium]